MIKEELCMPNLPELAQGEIKKALEGFGISPQCDLSRICRGAEGVVYRVIGSDSTYIAKLYGADKVVASRVSDEALLCDYLCKTGLEYGFTAPLYCQTENGERGVTVVTNRGPRVLFLMECVGDEEWEDHDDVDCAHIGATIAHLHTVLEKVTTNETNPFVEKASAWYRGWGLKAAVRRTIGRPTRHDLYNRYGFVRQIAHSPNRVVLHDALGDQVCLLDDRVRRYLSDVPDEDKLEQQLIHNDLKPSHIFFTQKGVCFIDWGSRRNGTIFTDLGTLLLHMWGEHDQTYACWRKHAQDILSGYSSIHLLHEHDIAYIYACVLQRAILSVAWYASIAEQTNRPIEVAKSIRIIKLIQELANEMQL